jgi:hypothetical protein
VCRNGGRGTKNSNYFQKQESMSGFIDFYRWFFSSEEMHKADKMPPGKTLSDLDKFPAQADLFSVIN